VQLEPPEADASAAYPNEYRAGASPEQLRSQRAIMVGIGLTVLAFLVIIAMVTVALLKQDVETTSKIADVFIIFMALESLIIGLVSSF
jgi:nitrate reductase gamma subunit